MEKIRIISDIHIDINRDYTLSYKDDIFTIICGDICGNFKDTYKWVKKNIKQGILVCGNHIVYNDEMKPISYIKEYLHKKFPVDSPVTLLENEVGVLSKEVDGILFVGSCMYTDYKLRVFGLEDVDEKFLITSNKWKSHYVMNDFNFGIRKMSKQIISYLTPDDYEEQFRDTMDKMITILEENEKKEHPLPVVLITHHPLSARCIAKRFKNSEVNASFVSDREDFIIRFPSIKLICSGHVHDSFQFNLDDNDEQSPLYIINPRGYIRSNEGKKFNPNLCVNTKTWKVD